MAENFWIAPSGAPAGVTAVKLTDDTNGGDWEPIAKAVGGRMRAAELADTGEYDGYIEFPGGETAGEGDWIVRFGSEQFPQFMVAPLDFEVDVFPWRELSDEERLSQVYARIAADVAR